MVINVERPDLTDLDPRVRAYIEALEVELKRFSPHQEQITTAVELEVSDPTELPTTLQLVTISRQGFIKRTPRHLYARQRRGGMGIFDLETQADDYPAFLSIADEAQSLLIFSNFARVFRLAVNKIPESPVRNRGITLQEWLQFEPDERVAAVLPDQATGYVAMVSQNGAVRSLRHHLFGNYMRPGTVFLNIKETGPLAAACWTPGGGDLVIATSKGQAIRFSEKLIPPKGEQGIRLAEDDSIIAVTHVKAENAVFLAGSDGKGTRRLMAGFTPNKSPGGGGKTALKVEKIKLIAAFMVEATDDIFMISRLGKIIRYHADEVPETEGVVQGVTCMALRSDEVIAAVRCFPAPIH